MDAITVVLLLATMGMTVAVVVLASRLAAQRQRVAEDANQLAERRLQEWRDRDLTFIQQQSQEAVARVQRDYAALAQQQTQDYQAAVGRAEQHFQALAQQSAENRFNAWKAASEQQIRQDAVGRSRAVILGKVTEHLIPFMPDFEFNPKDVRFVGSPVDLVVFDGLDAGEVKRVAFVEVKTGSASLTTRERQIRDAIRDRRVEWVELRSATPEWQNPQLPPPPSCPRCGQVQPEPSAGRCSACDESLQAG